MNNSVPDGIDTVQALEQLGDGFSVAYFPGVNCPVGQHFVSRPEEAEFEARRAGVDDKDSD